MLPAFFPIIQLFCCYGGKFIPEGKDGAISMKKLITLMIAALMLISTGGAETVSPDLQNGGHNVATALAAEVNPDALALVAFDAKITVCDGNMATITILVPERYDPEEIKGLGVGDGIYTEGREVEIRDITEADGYIVFNKDTEDEVFLFEAGDFSYWIADDNDNRWLELATVTVPVAEKCIFLDGINPKTGETLIHPTVYNLEGFLELMKSADDPGFDIRNVEAVIDEDGRLAVIRRFYVPWQ